MSGPTNTEVVTLNTLARDAYNTAGANREAALSIMIQAVQDDEHIYAQLAEPILRTAFESALISHTSALRRTILQRIKEQPINRAGLSNTAWRAATTRIGERRLFDFPIYGGKLLGNSTQADLIVAADAWTEQAKTNAHRASIVRTIAAHMPADDRTVSQVFDESDLEELVRRIES